MRPRISRKEAAYLTTVLEGQLEEMKQKLTELTQLERDYSRIIFELKNPVQVNYDSKGYFAGHFIWGDREKIALVSLARAIKEVHPNLLVEKFRLWECIHIHETLLQKYKAIANGEPHDGRYKHFSSQIRITENAEKILCKC